MTRDEARHGKAFRGLPGQSVGKQPMGIIIFTERERITMNHSSCKAGADLPPSELDSLLTCPHTRRCLLKAGINTLAQLRAMSRDDLLRVRGIGPVIADGILKAQTQQALPSDSKQT
jgi:DNA-directed RNA polymerase alpha subunit